MATDVPDWGTRPEDELSRPPFSELDPDPEIVPLHSERVDRQLRSDRRWALYCACVLWSGREQNEHTESALRSARRFETYLKEG